MMKFSFKINDKEYGVPEKYTVDQWIKLSKWQLKDKEDWVYIIAQATGAPLRELQEIEETNEELFSFMISIVFSAFGEVSGPLQKTIGKYKLMNLEEMTIGNFIDLDIYASDGNNFDKLIAKLYDMPVEEVKKQVIDLVMPTAQYYFNWRRSVYKNYATLFDYNEEMEGETRETGMSPAYAWYETVMVLCDGKFNNISAAVVRPFREAFNYLSWKKTKVNEEKMAMVELQNKYKK